MADASSVPPTAGSSNGSTTTTQLEGVAKLFANGKRPNILFIITDQERSLQHWPDDFVDRHLPSMARLQKHGLTFSQGFCNACMCSPSRASLLTSQYPVVTGVTTTGSPEPRVSLPTPEEDLANMATFLNQKYKYHCEWHGKWHLGNLPSDYGFAGWQPPDAGNYLSLNDSLGGGTPDNDGRFLTEITNFLESHTAKNNSNDDDDDDSEQQPFCLVASFVNPHDVYVAQYDPTLGYTDADFHKVHVPLPQNYAEDLLANAKPRCQADMGWPFVTFDNEPQDYVNFYAYLHTLVDKQIGTVLDTLDSCGLTDNTLIIRTADHGEQGLSHTLVEKFYNAYEESIRVPFIISNPVAFSKPYTTEALASHVDLLPTLLSLLEESAPAVSTTATTTVTAPPPPSSEQKSPEEDAPSDEDNPDEDGDAKMEVRPLPQFLKDSDCVGSSLCSLWKNPEAASQITRSKGKHKDVAVQQSIHFTYDDIPNRRAPSTVRCLRTMRYKYAVYFSPTGIDADWELYDLQKDPLENFNLAGRPEFETLQSILDTQLMHQMTHKQTTPTRFAWPPKASKYSVGKIGSGGGSAIRSKRIPAMGPNGYPELPIEEIMEHRRNMYVADIPEDMEHGTKRRSSDSSSSSSGGPARHS